MSNYTKATNFATKDTLPSGNSGKIVKGTELDDEFNAIASAVSSKADTASPTFTGTPAAPTASSGSNTTQLATTAYVKGEVDTSAALKADKTITVSAGAGLTGGGDLSANRTLALSTTGVTAATYGAATKVPVLAINDKGQITSASEATIVPFSWNVTYVNTAKDDDTSYTLPSNCIGLYVWCETYGGANNGGIGKVTIKNSGGTELGYVYVGGTNIGSGADGGSGMRDGVGTFVPVPSTATSVDFSTITNDVNSSWVVQAYVTKA
jgi:hypothetical protein